MKPLRVRQSTEVRQLEIVTVVLRLAAERSPGEITTSDIAKAMHLTQGALFKHFPTKEAIWVSVLGWVEDTLMAALKQAAEESRLPLEAMQSVFMTHVRFVMEHPGVPRIIFNDLQRPDDTPLKLRVRSLLMTYRQLLVRLLTAAKEAGSSVASDIDIHAAATLFIGTVQGLVMQSMLAGSSATMDIEARRVFQLYLRAIRQVP